MNSTPNKDPLQERRVWDLPVRIFHWLLVLAVAGAWATHKAGVTWFNLHVWCGYAVLVLVSFRIIWGFIGTRNARFWNFVTNPLATVRYGGEMMLGRDRHYAGHNPLGGWMVLLLLAALLTQALLGLFGNDEIFNLGPLYGYVTNERSLELTSLHRKLFYWILGAIGLHVLAVLYHRFFKREPLIRAMFTGRKSATVVSEVEAIDSSRIALALVVVAVLAAALTWVVRHAPVPESFSSFN